jgi:hypothetical protein
MSVSVSLNDIDVSSGDIYCDDVSDLVDILENSNLGLDDVIQEVLSRGHDGPEQFIDFDVVIRWIEQEGPEDSELSQLIISASMMLKERLEKVRSTSDKLLRVNSEHVERIRELEQAKALPDEIIISPDTI